MTPMIAVVFVAFSACAPAAPSRGEAAAPPQAPAKTKTLTIGVTSRSQSMGVFAGSSTGGWTTLIEMHTAGLITSDFDKPTPIGRLAEKVPSIEDGSISIQ